MNLPKRSTTGRLATKKARRHERWCCYDRCCLTRAQQQLQWESNRVSKANRSCGTERTTNNQQILTWERRAQKRVELRIATPSCFIPAYLERRDAFSYSTKMPHITLNAKGVVLKALSTAPLRSTFWRSALQLDWDSISFSLDNNTKWQQNQPWQDQIGNKRSLWLKLKNVNPRPICKSLWLKLKNVIPGQHVRRPSQWTPSRREKLTPIIGCYVPPLENALNAGEIFGQLKAS